jgi:5,6-dimethylbenzimidazole synthase
MSEDFSLAERDALYRAIALRRDVRAEFLPAPVDDDVLERILGAAHQAPSVGLSQPWRFIVVRDAATRRAVHGAFSRANEAAAAAYDPTVSAEYRALRLAGILDAPVNICVTCDDDPPAGRGLGRRTMPETARYSSVCAVQNLWLAARVEGIGVVAYLCVGYVRAFAPVADLERDRWEARLPLRDVVDYERYGAHANGSIT